MSDIATQMLQQFTSIYQEPWCSISVIQKFRVSNFECLEKHRHESMLI